MVSQDTVRLKIHGLDCPECAASLEKAVQQLDGVQTAQLSFTTSTIEVTPDDGAEIRPQLERLVASMGYELEPGPDQVAEAAASGQVGWRPWLQRHRREISTGVGGLLLLCAAILGLLDGPRALVNGLYAASIVLGGIYIARAGWMALRTARSLDMNALMTIAAFGAMIVGEFAEGAVTVFLFSIGELLESYTTDRARRAIRDLVGLAPNEATLKDKHGERSVAVSELQVGDLIIIRPGERIPMDGEIVEGLSAVNQAPITGESIPLSKAPGDSVFAGTINGNGSLLVRVTHLAQDNTIARIMHLVEEAQSKRAPAQRFVDRFARVYTPIVMALALVIAFFPALIGLGPLREWVYRALVLLVIACPCALVISVPITIVSALARAARSGVLVKGGRFLEELERIRVFALDKTGTLTEGRPYVTRMACDRHVTNGGACVSCDELVRKGAAIERRSEHALAQAVVDYAHQLGVDVQLGVVGDVASTPGMGIEGAVDGHRVAVGSHAFNHRDGRHPDLLCEEIEAAEREGYTAVVIEDECCDTRGYLAITDALREGAAEAIAALRQAGAAEVVMLTGDNRHRARQIADRVGIGSVRAELLPEDKARAIAELTEEHGPVAMVGDGVN
ncbi:MAG: cadmium-translocating P-type ATPase, partial [Anaerolineae bacterium]|nr:cadmium-translocating P-type ATPase [Anaerolineae bacterium]